MEIHIKSIIFLLCVTIAGNSAAPIGSNQGNGEMISNEGSLKKIHVISHRKLVVQPTGLFDGGDKNKSKDPHHAHVKVSKDGVEVTAGPVYVHVKPGVNPFTYSYLGQHKGEDGRSLFFLEKDMKAGHRMSMNFTKSTNKAVFLPKAKARSLYFSTKKMPEILHEFSVKPGSKEAEIIEETIKGCESKGIPGEKKYCATCLEDMIDYAKSILGKKVKAISTKAKERYNKGQRYTFGQVTKASKHNVVCHKQNYAYAVYYCHKTKGASSHIVSLINEDGKKAKVVVICHKDTSAWHPKHLAFRALKVKPGSVPICHFLPEDHIVWVPV